MTTRKYKGTILNQTCVFVIDGVPYWLMYDNQYDDYILIRWEGDETKKLIQVGSPQVAKLQHFDEELVSKYFGQVDEILVFMSGYSALCYLQDTKKSQASYKRVSVDRVRVVTMQDIKNVFGENIRLEV